MKPTSWLPATPFLASLFLSSTRETGRPGTVTWASADLEVARMVKATDPLGVWGKKTCAMSSLCYAKPLSSDLKQLSTKLTGPQAGFLKEPCLCSRNIASSGTVHTWMCRTLCFAGLQISTRFNSPGFPGSNFSQQQKSCPPLPYLLYEGFLH